MNPIIGVVILLALGWLIRWWVRRANMTVPASIRSGRGGQSAGRGSAASNTISISAASKPTRVDARWVQPGESVAVRGISITGGLFYLGSSLPNQYGYENEGALINGSLDIGRTPGNLTGAGVPYYPSYSRIDVGSRRAFVEWLASNRSDPSTYIGYVFIYFYGLERRLIVDNALNETPIIVAEVQRLLSTYGANDSFYAYASRLLEAAAVITSTWLTVPPIDLERKPFEMPLRLRGTLGHFIQQGTPISADWALAWYLWSPECKLRTPAKRCFAEFVALFCERFAVAYPRGLSVQEPRRRLSAQYRACSGSFTVQLRGEFEKLADVVALTKPLAEIGRIVEDCTAALDHYSRLVGRDPAAAQTITAELSLPQELTRDPKFGPAIAAMRERIAALAPKTSAMVLLVDLMNLLGFKSESAKKLGRSEAIAVASALERLGFAIEPDPRHGGPTPSLEAQVMIFHWRTPHSADADPAQFAAARIQIEISVLVASAQGQFGEIEARSMIGKIRSLPELSDFERARLIAYLGYLVRNPPGKQVINRFKNRGLEERKAVAELATASAAMNGSLEAEEVKLLERTYRTLGLPKEELYRGLHALGIQKQAPSAVDDPPTVVAAEPTRGRPIPPPPAAPSKLNKNRIVRIQADTVAVQTILGNVFSEPEPENGTVDDNHARNGVGSARIQGMADDESLPGLDQRYAFLLKALSDRDEIDQADFAILAKKHGVLPGGAIEAINEWAFRTFDEPLLDDGEPIEIAHHLIRLHDSVGVSGQKS
jgi:tellurite resistance protein